MPTIDGGHIFLTCLFPVLTGAVGEGEILVPHSHRLREELATMPVAQQSPKTEEAGQESPFARCRRTHLLRLFLIDQPMFNGRLQTDPVKNAVKNAVKAILPGLKPRDISVHETFDTLARPWLALAADIDRRPDQADEGVASWAEGLWRSSEAELRAIFEHCHGFDSVRDGASFAAYVKRCQIDTTMSFNDYWDGRPPLKGASLVWLGAVVAAFLLAVAVLAWSLLGPAHLLWALPLALALAAWGAIRSIDAAGRKPFPAAPDSDLPSVLKALHVQQWFTLFAESAQMLPPAERHAAFGHFLASVRPDDIDTPTQRPGVIRSDWVHQEPPVLDQAKESLP